jgi:metal-responsive CopG/Arc/MetJ family transcriptional regulator
MKVRTSITLSKDLIQELDKLLGQSRNRSAFVEQVLHDFLATRARQIDAAKELEILNRHADELNEEATDVLSYQVEW